MSQNDEPKLTHGEPDRPGAEEPLDSRAQEMLDLIMSQGGLDGGGLELYGGDGDSFQVALKEITETLELPENPAVVYSGSSTHIGVAEVFGKDSVIHIDPEEKVYRVMSDAGYQIEQTTIEEFQPKSQADILVALNSYGAPTPDMIRRVIKTGGYIITNNYTRWAEELSDIEGLELVAAVMRDYRLPDAQIVSGADIPDDATAFREVTYRIGKDGRINSDAPDANVFTDEVANYPDALFVFQVQ